MADEGGVGEALARDADEGAKGGDAGADDGHVGFEGGPDAYVDVVPCPGSQFCGRKKTRQGGSMDTCNVQLLQSRENDDPDDAH